MHLVVSLDKGGTKDSDALGSTDIAGSTLQFGGVGPREVFLSDRKGGFLLSKGRTEVVACSEDCRGGRKIGNGCRKEGKSCKLHGGESCEIARVCEK